MLTKGNAGVGGHVCMYVCMYVCVYMCVLGCVYIYTIAVEIAGDARMRVCVYYV